MADQKRIIDEAKKEMMLNHQMAIEEEQKKIKNMDQYASQLKAKLRMSDENVSRLVNQYIPKLKETKLMLLLNDEV